MQIIPAILTNNPQELKDLINKAEEVVNRVQIDIIDETFDNKTIEPTAMEHIETNLSIDFHLMSKNPTDWVEKCARGQAGRIIGQIEHMEDQLKFIAKVQEVGAQVGLGVDLETSIDHLSQEAVQSSDVILLMSVPAGHGGQIFDLRIWDKIKDLKKLKGNFKICVDGGITRELINDLKKSGVDEIVVGKRIFEGDLKNNIETWLR
jgi:ribulose-phosphate 3-epimerase